MSMRGRYGALLVGPSVVCPEAPPGRQPAPGVAPTRRNATRRLAPGIAVAPAGRTRERAVQPPPASVRPSGRPDRMMRIAAMMNGTAR